MRRRDLSCMLFNLWRAFFEQNIQIRGQKLFWDFIFYLFIYLLFIYSFYYLLVYLSVCLFIYLFVYLFICLFNVGTLKQLNVSCIKMVGILQERMFFFPGVIYFCILVRALSFISAFLVMLVRCVEKSSLLAKVIPSSFSSLLSLVVTLLDMSSVFDTVADWDSMGRVITQTHGLVFQTLGQAFETNTWPNLLINGHIKNFLKSDLSKSSFHLLYI